MNTKNLSLWFAILLTILIPVFGMVIGVGVMLLLGLSQTDYGNLMVNLCFLAGVVALVRINRCSGEDLGLKVIKDQMQMHVVLALIIFALYILFYLFVIQISMLKPISSSTLWGLVTYLIVAIVEEVYFRGALYSFFEKRFSARTALIVSSILFGLFHAQQGVDGILSKMLTGWLWGSIRYSTGMIFLLVIPIHFVYNSTWLLFEGNWSHPPTWATYTLPLVEFALGLVIVMVHNRKLEHA